MPTFNEPDNLEDLGYKYNKDKDSYTKIDNDGGKIEYMPHISSLKYYKIYNGLEYKLIYNIDEYKINYVIFDKMTETTKILKYFVKVNKFNCTTEECSKYYGEIGYLLNIYNEIKSTL